MQAVILAGGRGTRLKPLTDNIPKPMVPVHGKPFLHYQLELVKSYGIEDFILLIGYKGEQIENYFGDGTAHRLRIRYSREKELLGTGGALKNAAALLDKNFILLNGDTYFPIDYNALLRYYEQHQKLGVVVAHRGVGHAITYNMAIGDGNRVTDYNKRDKSGKTHVDAGTAVWNKAILKMIPESRVCSLEEEIYPKLIDLGQLLAFPTEQMFYDIGSPEGLRVIEGILK